MKVIVLYRARSEFATDVEDFVREFQNRHNINMRVLDMETREGIEVATVYDIMQYPAILVTRDDGTLQKNWEGPKLPLLDEVYAYVQA